MAKDIGIPLEEQDFSEKTERELWMIIEAYGGEIFMTNRQANKGNIDDDLATEHVKSYRSIQERAVEQIIKRFGVVFYPKGFDGKVEHLPQLSDGQKYYRDWYEEWKLKFLQEELETLICSACPFIGDVQELSRHIPCTILPSGMTLYNLHPAWRCGLVPFDNEKSSSDELTLNQLYEKIREKGGESTVEKFLKKQKDLQIAYSKK